MYTVPFIFQLDFQDWEYASLLEYDLNFIIYRNIVVYSTSASHLNPIYVDDGKKSTYLRF